MQETNIMSLAEWRDIYDWSFRLLPPLLYRTAGVLPVIAYRRLPISYLSYHMLY